jgi:hypothetical protein
MRAQTQIGSLCNNSIEFVCLSNARISPLFEIDIHTKNQAAIPTLIDYGASSNFISPTVIEQHSKHEYPLNNPYRH